MLQLKLENTLGGWICVYENRRLKVEDDLRNAGNPSDYIRSETKTKIYDQLRVTHPSVFTKVASTAWFKEKYASVYKAWDSTKEPTTEPTAPTPSMATAPVTPTTVASTPTTTPANDALLAKLVEAVDRLSKPNDTDKKVLEALEQIKKPTAFESHMIEAIISKGAELSTEKIETELKAKLDTFIKDTYGILPTTLTVKVGDLKTNSISGIFHEKFKDILTMVASNVPVMVTGQAGTGKNYTMEQVAEALGIDFYYTGAVTQEYKITGFIDAGGSYHETEFYKAFTKGGLFMLDEVDASAPEVLVILNAAIANRYFDFPNGRVSSHKDFRVVCAGNTYGTGADMIYVGRNVLDGATLDRFVVIKMDYDEKVESQLCPDEEYYAFVKEMRRVINKNKLRHIVGMRASINGFKALSANMSKKFVIESIICKGMSKDDLQVITKNIKSGGSEWYTELTRYFNQMEG